MANSVTELNPDRVREDLQRLRLRQADMIKPLHEKGIDASPSQISLAVNGKGLAPRFQKILAAIAEIIEEEDRKYENR